MTIDQIKKHLMSIESEKRCLGRMVESIAQYRAKLGSPPGAGLDHTRVQGVRQCMDEALAILCDLDAEYERRLVALLAREGRVYRAIACLDPCEQEIIVCKYLHGMTWDEVGEAVHYSEAQARRRCRKAMALLSIFDTEFRY